MPALSAILDYNLKQISEPGFGKQIPARTLAVQGNAKADGNAPKALWAPPLAHTVMLRPRQLDKSWLNSSQALPWIIRRDDFDINPGDLSSGAIFEDAAFGNTTNPWIYHIATLIASYFPTVIPPGEPPLPTAGPNLLGFDPGIGAGEPSLLNAAVRPTEGYALTATVPAKGSEPVPSKVVDTTTGRHLAQTSSPLPANQPLFLRWVHAASQLGFPPVYRFYIGQFLLEIKDSVVQIFEDDSASGNRTHFRSIATYPLWSGVDDDDGSGIGAVWQSLMQMDDFLTHERSLLWLPMRRNQVLLLASPGGKAKLLQTRPAPVRLADNSDWNIVRSDKLLLWVLTPIWGRFQVQRVAYQGGGVEADAPPILLDYTPASVPDHTLYADTDHGTSIGVTRTSPPVYAIPYNSAVECPTVPASIPSYQARQYGYQLVFNASADAAWTPFYYNLLVSKTPVLVNSTATTKTVNDTTSGSPAANQSTLVEVRMSAGRKPGEGRMTLNLWDYSPYPLASYYYRCGYPIRVTNGGTAVFTGYTTNQGLHPLKVAPGARQLSVTVADRWYQLTNAYLRDNRNWAGVGHIDVIQNIMQQCGVDTAGMDTPPKNAQYNQILGDLPTSQVANEVSGQTLSPWQPKIGENAAAFLTRIAEHFSGWDIGFDASGVPFYLPRYYYTTSEITFYETQAAATAAGQPTAPLFKDVQFSTVEPEANVVMVKAVNKNTGQPMYSSLYIDWAAIQNPAKVNYLGRRKVEIVEIAGAYSCAGINWAARTIWTQTRRRHVIARFEAQWNATPKVGHVLTLHGYGDYRVISYSCTFHKGTHQRMDIEAEFVETGF